MTAGRSRSNKRGAAAGWNAALAERLVVCERREERKNVSEKTKRASGKRVNVC